MGITTPQEAIKMVNDFVNSPQPTTNQRREIMAFTIVELARESLRRTRNLEWLRRLALQQYEYSVKTPVAGFDPREKARHNVKIVLWHNVLEVIARRRLTLERWEYQRPRRC